MNTCSNCDVTKQLVKRIGSRIVGIHWDDLTDAEQQIATLLINGDYFTRDAEGNLSEVEQ